MPKVSIVIPIYNVAKYLYLSVESAMAQTEQDIEIILVDDGSTDGSAEKCDEYAEKDNRIKVIHKENGGVSSARNTGIANVSAKYILLLDGDDYLHEQAVERLLEIESKYPSDIIQFQYEEVSELKQLPVLNDVTVSFQSKTSKEAFDKLYEMGGVCASCCTKLFRKEILKNIPFEITRYEDEMWCTRAYVNNITITYVPDVLYGYVMHSESFIHSAFSKSRLDIIKVKEERIATLQKLELYNLEKKEWNNLFTVMLLLYKDAKMESDKKIILNYFKEKPIIKKVKICGKMRVFYLIAKLNKKFSLDLYSLYWSLKT